MAFSSISGVSGSRRAARKQSLVLVRGDAVEAALHDHEPRLVGKLRDQSLDQRLEVLVEEHDLRTGMAEDVGDLLGREPDVDRVQDRAGLEHAVVGLEQLVGVVGDEADSVARLDTQFDQRVRQAMGSLAELAVREATVTVDDADSLAVVRLGPVTELENRKGNEHRRPPAMSVRG